MRVKFGDGHKMAMIVAGVRIDREKFGLMVREGRLLRSSTYASTWAMEAEVQFLSLEQFKDAMPDAASCWRSRKHGEIEIAH